MKTYPALLAAASLLVCLAGCDSRTSTGAPAVVDELDSGGASLDGAGDGSDAATPEDVTVEPDVPATPDASPADPGPADTAPTDAAPTPDAVPTEDVPVDPPDEGGGGVVLPEEPPPLTGTESTFIGDWTMTPGQETTRCVVKRLTNADEMWVGQIRTVLAPGSHHMIVYKIASGEERPEPFGCTPFTETLSGEGFPLMITQIPEETLTFPPGVAFRFEPGQLVRIEAHYLNYYPDDIVAHGDVHFDTIAAEDVVAEASLLFYGTADVDIPANSQKTNPWRFLEVKEEQRVFALTGHTHQLGTNVEIEFATGESTPGDPIYPPDATYAWDEPPVVRFDPALRFDGDNGFRYRCSWNNTTNKDVGLGESGDDEMCFFWAYYYNATGGPASYRLCVNTAPYYPGSVCCPGHFACDLIKNYF